MATDMSTIVTEILNGNSSSSSENNSKYDELIKLVKKIINDAYTQDGHGGMTPKIDTLSTKINKLEKDIDNSIVKSKVEPSNPVENMLWVDTTDKVIKIRTQNKWTILGAGW